MLIEEYLRYYQDSPYLSEDENIAQMCGVSIQRSQMLHVGENPPEQVNQAATLDVEHVSIKTCTVDLVYPGGRRRVVLALDSGANNTNIDAGLVRELGLDIIRQGLQREVHMVNGTHKFLSDFVTFDLCPVGQEHGPFFRVGASTVEDLVAGTHVADWLYASTRYPYLQPSKPTKPLLTDKVSILLGTDFAHLLVGKKTLTGDTMGEPMGPVAELTPLGWAYQGRTGKFSTRGISNLNYHQSFITYSRNPDHNWMEIPQKKNKILEIAGFVQQEEDHKTTDSSVNLVILESERCSDKLDLRAIQWNYCCELREEFPVSLDSFREASHDQTFILHLENVQVSLVLPSDNGKIPKWKSETGKAELAFAQSLG